jgi:NAD(P)-dependent dehydrogenase (short-subunit alcohol dehydrogenase family)
MCRSVGFAGAESSAPVVNLGGERDQSGACARRWTSLTDPGGKGHLSPGGTVVIIGSTASTRSEYGMSLYGGAKAALRQMVRTWIRELQGSGIRVNVVSAGAIDTPSLRSALAGSIGEDQVEARVAEMGAGNPIGRLGTPRDIGKSVVFLASDDSSFVTGVELFTDGGMAQTG